MFQLVSSLATISGNVQKTKLNSLHDWRFDVTDLFSYQLTFFEHIKGLNIYERARHCVRYIKPPYWKKNRFYQILSRAPFTFNCDRPSAAGLFRRFLCLFSRMCNAPPLHFIDIDYHPKGPNRLQHFISVNTVNLLFFYKRWISWFNRNALNVFLSLSTPLKAAGLERNENNKPRDNSVITIETLDKRQSVGADVTYIGSWSKSVTW